MADLSAEANHIEKLYQFGERLNESKDKSQNVKDYQGIIDAANLSIKSKQLAAQLIPRFFKFFPNLSGPALDCHLDLLEEEDLGISFFYFLFYIFDRDCLLSVRVQAIRDLPLFCKDNPENVSKIVYILVQLLADEDFVARDAVNKALMSLLRQDVKASLTTLFGRILNVDEPSTEELIREKILNFVRDKVFPAKAELLKPQEEMERHITDLIKKSLEDVTGAEFRMFMDFLKGLSLFGDKASPERMKELVALIEAQADLDAQFTPSDRLGEDFTEHYREFTERLNVVEELTRATMKKLTQGMAEHNKAMAASKSEDEKNKVKTQKQNTTSGLRTCNNILAMTKPLHSKTPLFIGDKIITLSWKEATQASVPAAANVPGKKRPSSTLSATGAVASKKGRGTSGMQNQLVNRALEGLSQGGRGGMRGRGRGWGGGRGRGTGYC
ncbi:hypothetical protein SAY87_022320 [Trapa incisa]|uniref:Apoptosis inhibitor 5 n=1 Tax=Trapa incisa TaxID=236973 RepID=A0AAN7K407_9MYRT|nr:hypothetical protein SAY87_022320 [Trapa incisa]